MGSLDRKHARNELKKQYKLFMEEWKEAKASGKKVNGKELGSKIGFGEFVKRLKAYEAIQAVQRKVEEAKIKADEKNIDLEWKDS